MSKKVLPQFKLGDTVRWSSHGGWVGKVTHREKIGEVVAVVQPGVCPSRQLGVLVEKHGAKSMWGGGFARAHESYIVLVDRGPGRKPDLYWPRVSGLGLEK